VVLWVLKVVYSGSQMSFRLSHLVSLPLIILPMFSCGKGSDSADTAWETGEITAGDCALSGDSWGADAQAPVLTVEELFDGDSEPTLMDYGAFSSAQGDGPALHQFNGRLELAGGGESTSDLWSISWWVAPEMGSPSLPEIDLGFVQCGDTLIPTQRGRISTTDQYWDLFVSSGKVWSNPNDISPTGAQLSRAAFPFALAFKVENCLQNGVMTFLFNDIEISDVRYQVSSETCPFLKFDLYGQSPAEYHRGELPESSEVLEQWSTEQAATMDVLPFSTLFELHPELSSDSLDLGLTLESQTSRGMIVDGQIYLDDCRTRSGSYPFCDTVLLPAYSITKTLHLGVGMAAIAQEFEVDPYDELLSEMLPEAFAQAEGDWSEVTIEHTVDMATGHYVTADQGDDHMTDFFTEFSLESRLASSFAFPYKEAPGERTVYLTPNSQLASAAMDQFLLRESSGAEATVDSFGFVVERVYSPLGVSTDSLGTLRTWEEGGENNGTAFGGYGMVLTPQNIAIITEFMQGDGSLEGVQVLEPEKWSATMFRDLEDTGAPMYYYDWSYNNGMWGYPLTSFGCEGHVPIMFGVSGNTVILAPNGITYFSFNDEAEFPVYNVLNQLNAISPLCE
jgi:CubicO group peptidase (beta-lactamase class C family)